MIDTHFREMPSQGFPTQVLKDPRNPLIYVTTEFSSYACKESDKKDLIETFQAAQDHMLLFVWQGQGRSDVFKIPADKVDSVLQQFNSVGGNS